MIFVKLHQLVKDSNENYYLSEVHVNVSHIMFISENSEMTKSLKEGKINIGLNTSAKFSDVLLSSSGKGSQKIVVVGDPNTIESKINKSNKTLLRG